MRFFENKKVYACRFFLMGFVGENNLFNYLKDIGKENMFVRDVYIFR